jgi:transient receptor potential cation channel subfamily C protein 4
LLSFKSAFWALFGLGNPDYVIINDFRNQLTENFGTILYGSYHIAAIIVLLNMLVASMTQSFEKILVFTAFLFFFIFQDLIISKYF